MCACVCGGGGGGEHIAIGIKVVSKISILLTIQEVIVAVIVMDEAVIIVELPGSRHRRVEQHAEQQRADQSHLEGRERLDGEPTHNAHAGEDTH